MADRESSLSSSSHSEGLRATAALGDDGAEVDNPTVGGRTVDCSPSQVYRPVVPSGTPATSADSLLPSSSRASEHKSSSSSSSSSSMEEEAKEEVQPSSILNNTPSPRSNEAVESQHAVKLEGEREPKNQQDKSYPPPPPPPPPPSRSSTPTAMTTRPIPTTPPNPPSTSPALAHTLAKRVEGVTSKLEGVAGEELPEDLAREVQLLEEEVSSESEDELEGHVRDSDHEEEEEEHGRGGVEVEGGGNIVDLRDDCGGENGGETSSFLASISSASSGGEEFRTTQPPAGIPSELVIDDDTSQGAGPRISSSASSAEGTLKITKRNVSPTLLEKMMPFEGGGSSGDAHPSAKEDEHLDIPPSPSSSLHPPRKPDDDDIFIDSPPFSPPPPSSSPLPGRRPRPVLTHLKALPEYLRSGTLSSNSLLALIVLSLLLLAYATVSWLSTSPASIMETGSSGVLEPGPGWSVERAMAAGKSRRALVELIPSAREEDHDSEVYPPPPPPTTPTPPPPLTTVELALYLKSVAVLHRAYLNATDEHDAAAGWENVSGGGGGGGGGKGGDHIFPSPTSLRDQQIRGVREMERVIAKLTRLAARDEGFPNREKKFSCRALEEERRLEAEGLRVRVLGLVAGLRIGGSSEAGSRDDGGGGGRRGDGGWRDVVEGLNCFVEAYFEGVAGWEGGGDVM
ncbi:uncharacterized protein MYCGRDRAFT_97790 [Zymoseptoria tritici IPO323]|uniref:Uncharacterized protein n=1 Tax=Zymoseptoria tritici (strain CBS 115943 / IPO323) TaxID=336722 RepID=F9XRD8_ZYMTI|nr:uncharacterized protein MYCGRDRAFT_97790 [Zymoseptoria tritici IPO323]EGP82120.1 hypothetical protein MYCGRDRAFT_97790 [Zymoseptoria tritici IPO323]